MRKIAGSLALVSWIVGYVAVAAVLGDRVADEHWGWQLLYYPAAGLLWVIPLKPLLRWMHARDAPLDSPDV
jgi:hypothetical protein